MLCLYLAAPAVLRAEPGCDEGLLGGHAVAMANILKSAADKRVFNLDTLTRFVDAAEWTNPFGSATHALTGGLFNRAFIAIDSKLKDRDRAEVKSLIRKYLDEQGVQTAIVNSARQATAQIISPVELMHLKSNAAVSQGPRSMLKYTLDGRPIFFERLMAAGGGPDPSPELSMVGMLYDPMNPDTKKRVVAIPFKDNIWLKEHKPLFVKFENRDLLIYPDLHLVFDLNQGKVVSDEFTPGEISGIEAGLEFNAIQAGRTARPVSWDVNGATISFSGGGMQTQSFTVPKNLRISEYFAPVIFRSGSETFAAVPCVKDMLVLQLLADKQMVFVINLTTGKKTKPYPFNHVGLGGTIKGGTPHLYNVETLDSGYLRLNFINMKDGSISSTDTQADEEIYESSFNFRGTQYLTWIDERGLIVYDIEGGSQIVTNIRGLGTGKGSFTFSYLGNWYLFVPGKMAHVIQLTGAPG